MKRPMHLAMALIAAIMHLGVPVAAYAAMSADALPSDICSVGISVAGSAASASAYRNSPSPASHEHHCAHAPCCASGAVDAAAPPPVVPSVLRISVHRESAPATASIAVPVPPIAAAQPRGPPPLA